MGVETAPSRETGSRRRRLLLLLRLTLFTATAYLLVGESGFAHPPSALLVVLAVGLAACVAPVLLSDAIVDASWFLGATMVVDTLWVTAALVASGHVEADFLFLYFFVLFLAAIGENVRLIVLGAVVVGGAYLAAVVGTGGIARILSPGSLLRLPFLFSVALFYGYLVERIRREKQRAEVESKEHRLIEGERQELERANVQLGQANSKLEDANAELARQIAERREIEEALRRANQQLEQVSEMKTAFVSTVSHELRTPLTAIRNAVDLLASIRKHDLTEAEAKFVGIAQRNTDRLARIVKDLLDLSRSEAGKLEFRFEDLEVEPLLRAIAASFDAEAKSAAIELRVECAGGLPAVRADAQRLDQVFANLVGNALKFTPKRGTVRIVAERNEEGIEIAVVDTGVGISAEDRARVFEPFFQAGDSLTGKARGTGLGLSIATDLVEAHGALLELESTPGKGSRFHFTLGRAGRRAEEATALETAARGLRGFPYFAALAVAPSDPASARGEKIEQLGAFLRSNLPRQTDLVLAQSEWGRVVLLLPSTTREGAVVLARKLLRLFASIEGAGSARIAGVRVLGPAVFPQEGRSGVRLMAAALASGEVTSEVTS